MKILLLFFITFSCSWTQTKDLCHIEKHSKDQVFQVLINKIPINNRWYLQEDAQNIVSKLQSENKCSK